MRRRRRIWKGKAEGRIGDDFAVYYNGNNVAGYRDAGGQFYDPQGQPVMPNAVITNSSVRPRLLPGAAPGRLDARAFRRARTYAVFQPRVSARLAVSRFASAFAYADRTAQAAPDALRRASLADYEDRLQGSGSVGNPDLRPERATTYGIGGRAEAQGVALTVEVFQRNYQDLASLTARKNTYPNNFATGTSDNAGRVRGVEAAFDVARRGGLALRAAYTLQESQSTVDAAALGNIFWLREANPFVPSFLSSNAPGQFAKATFDFRTGAGEGPRVFGHRPLGRSALVVFYDGRSGRPYSRLLDPYPIDQGVRLSGLTGNVNGSRTPWTHRVDLYAERGFGVR